MTYAHTRSHAKMDVSRMPLAGLVEPFGFVGEAIYSGVTTTARAISGVFKAWERRDRYKQTVDELGSLEDHVLRDIGIARGEIRAVARHCAENPGIDYRHTRQRNE